MTTTTYNLPIVAADAVAARTHFPDTQAAVLEMARNGLLTVAHHDLVFDGIRPFVLRTGRFLFFVESEEVAVSKSEFSTVTIPRPGGGRLRYRVSLLNNPFAREFAKAFGRGGIEELLAGAPGAADPRPSPQTFRSDSAWPDDAGASAVAEGAFSNPNMQLGVDFGPSEPNSVYHWELFYHVPLLLAERLSDSGSFAEADRWLRFVFDPTRSSDPLQDGLHPSWRCAAFMAPSSGPGDSPLSALQGERVASDAFRRQVEAMREDPFDPHRIAALRPAAYQRAAVMQYLDNLIAWGDHLFRQYSAESLAEASVLYVMAARILGERPTTIAAPEAGDPVTVQSVLDGDAAHEGLATMESFGGAVPTARPPEDERRQPSPDMVSFSNNFCVPENDRLLGYWDTVADRLFKIRHCLDIEGAHRDVALFAPPIDPALLVRAAASGLDFSAVAAELASPSSPYRAGVLLNRARAYAESVRGLGGALLSALEKNDAEELSLLRTRHESAMLNATRAVRASQIDEAASALESAQARLAIAQQRLEFYTNRPSEIRGERRAASFEKRAAKKELAASVLQGLASGFSVFPKVEAGASGWGVFATVAFGPTQFIGVTRHAAMILENIARRERTLAGTHSRNASYDRRQEDWDHAAAQAKAEIAQIEKDIAAAEIRVALAVQEANNLELQIGHSNEVRDFLSSKYTNKDLYSWMIGRLRVLHRQTYDLAHGLAVAAERAILRESGLTDLPRVRAEGWDGARDGLLGGEELLSDLRNLEADWLRRNRRKQEITRNIALSRVDSAALVLLRLGQNAQFTLTDDWLSAEFPGQSSRRIRSVSFTVVASIGSYQSVPIHIGMQTAADEPAGQGPMSTLLSHGQNDFGLFEPSLQSDRYLPFEGAELNGSQWSLQTIGTVMDTSTISDVILHVRYECESTDLTVTPPVSQSGTVFLTARGDFPDEFLAMSGSDFDITLLPKHFPPLASGAITVTNVQFAIPADTTLTTAGTTSGTVPESGLATTLTLSDPAASDVLIAVHYDTAT